MRMNESVRRGTRTIAIRVYLLRHPYSQWHRQEHLHITVWVLEGDPKTRWHTTKGSSQSRSTKENGDTPMSFSTTYSHL